QHLIDPLPASLDELTEHVVQLFTQQRLLPRSHSTAEPYPRAATAGSIPIISRATARPPRPSEKAQPVSSRRSGRALDKQWRRSHTRITNASINYWRLVRVRPIFPRGAGAAPRTARVCRNQRILPGGPPPSRHLDRHTGAGNSHGPARLVGVSGMTTASETEARATSDNNGTLNELPLLRNERIFGFWGYSSVNIGLSIATWAFLQGGAVAVYVGAKAAVASIVIGYGISVLMVALVPCIPTAKYGIEQWVSLRSVFGQNGARLLMITAVALLAAAWNAVLAIMFGHALRNVSNQVVDTELSSSGTVVSLISLAAVVFVWVVLSRGAISVEWVN